MDYSPLTNADPATSWQAETLEIELKERALLGEGPLGEHLMALSGPEHRRGGLAISARERPVALSGQWCWGSCSEIVCVCVCVWVGVCVCFIYS